MIEFYGLTFNTQAALGCFILVYGFVILAFSAVRDGKRDQKGRGISWYIAFGGIRSRTVFGIFAALAGGLLL
tara:strand:+ start:410 stop:625 length:216 start_codon:yes stop_codon:yes gene_type:complete